METAMRKTELAARRLLLEEWVASPAPGVYLVFDGRETWHVVNYRCDCPSRTVQCVHAVAALLYELRTPVTLFG
jgi:hypothetical protein